eukprot:614957-Pelagomonas_calceolata.AAC.1
MTYKMKNTCCSDVLIPRSARSVKRLQGLQGKKASVKMFARKLHAHSVMYANRLVTTWRAIENKNTSCSQ